MEKRRGPGRPRKVPQKAPTTKQQGRALSKIVNFMGGGSDWLNQWGLYGAPQGDPITQLWSLWKNNRWYLLSNLRQLLSESYVEHGLIQTLVDVPVDDAMRGGVEVQSKQLSAEEVQELSTYVEREGDLRTYAQAEKWKRLFGGAGILILNGQDPKTPIELDRMEQGDPLEFRDCDMWELFYTKQNTKDYGSAIDASEWYDPEYYDYYGKAVHKSRVIKLVGLKAPSFIRPRLRGWGFSVVEILMNSLNQYLKSNNLVYELLDEFKVDYYKIKNLSNTLLSGDGWNLVQQRVQDLNRGKNYQHAAVMDSEDDWMQKQLSFTGIAETMVSIRMQIASEMRMPLTKIFGISAAGFSSGEDDIENYNAMVESTIRERARFHILTMLELRCIELFGDAPDDLSIDFKPLRILGAEAEENVKTQRFNRVLATAQAGLMTVEEFKNAVNKDNLVSIQLDPSIDKIEMAPEEDTEGSEVSPAGPAAETKKTPKEAPEAKS